MSILDIWDNYGHHFITLILNVRHGLPGYQPTDRFSDYLHPLNNPARAIEFSGDPVLTMQDWTSPMDSPVAAKTGTTDNFTG